ncbi:MAG: glycoside hydrolase family 76 protein, partial [Verrucomicrobiota bacterium]
NLLKQHPDVLSTTVSPDDCRVAAEQAWQMMTDHAWNGSGWLDDGRSPNPPAPSDGGWNQPPAECGFGSNGARNAVTNGVYAVLGSRLYKVVKKSDPASSQPYLQQACDVFNWLNANMEMWTRNGLGAHPGLIHELPVSCKASNYSLWSGDQGLWLAGMIDLWSHREEFSTVTNPPDPDAIKTAINRLISAIPSLLFDADLVLHEAPFEGNYLGDPVDLVTGKGVLLRYIMNVRRELRTIFFTPEDSELYRERIQSTADSLWKQPGWILNATEVISPEWNPGLDGAFRQDFQRQWGANCATYTDASWNKDLFNSVIGACAVQTCALGALLTAAAAESGTLQVGETTPQGRQRLCLDAVGFDRP